MLSTHGIPAPRVNPRELRSRPASTPPSTAQQAGWAGPLSQYKNEHLPQPVHDPDLLADLGDGQNSDPDLDPCPQPQHPSIPAPPPIPSSCNQQQRQTHTQPLQTTATVVAAVGTDGPPTPDPSRTSCGPKDTTILTWATAVVLSRPHAQAHPPSTCHCSWLHRHACTRKSTAFRQPSSTDGKPRALSSRQGMRTSSPAVARGAASSASAWPTWG